MVRCDRIASEVIAMSSRRSSSPRSRKSRNPPPQPEVLAAPSASVDVAPEAPRDATQTSQLRALESGWDELLG
jgi:hypothetical protein